LFPALTCIKSLEFGIFKEVTSCISADDPVSARIGAGLCLWLRTAVEPLPDLVLDHSAAQVGIDLNVIFAAEPVANLDHRLAFRCDLESSLNDVGPIHA
jgi:hypothetical protein